MRVRLRTLPLFVCFISGFINTATASEPAIEEIVVTAEKRESSLQETPIAITVLSNSMVEDRNIDDMRKISSLTPSMVYNMSAGNAQIYMRGVGTDVNTITTEPGVAMFVDGVYLGTTSDQAATFENIERIEVLRGPQGTLYGRNTTGGNVNVITKLPGAEPDFSASLLYGDYDRVKASVSGGGSLIDGLLAARVSLVKETADGYRDNAFNGDDLDDRDTFSSALSVVVTPSDTFELILRGDWSEADQDNPLLDYGEEVPGSGLTPFLFGGQQGSAPDELRLNSPTEFDRENWGLSATISWDITDVTLRSISAYRETINNGVQDNDGTDISFLNVVSTQESEMFSQEINLLGTINDNFDWILGAYYFDQRSLDQFEFELAALQPFFETIFGFSSGGLGDPAVNFLFGERLAGGGSAIPFLDFTNTQDTESVAFFAQGTYHVSDRIRVTAGIRRTDDEKTNLQTITNNIAPGKCSNLDLEDDWQETTYKLSGDYDFSDSVLMYATYSKGFKSGGFNTGSCNDRFDPETVTAYEVGLKSTFADGRLRLNLAAYLYDYEDFQARLFINNASLIENASDVENLGFEAEFVWVPVDALQIDGGLSIMESEFKSFVSDDPLDPPGLVDLEGNQTLRSPDVSYNVGVQYMHWFDQGGGDITVRYEASYKDDYFTTVFNNDFAEIESHAIQNFRVIWNANNQWQVQGFVENFTDEEVLESLLASATIGGTIVSWTPPRLWGVQVRYTM